MTLNGDKTILVLFRRQENTNQKKTPYLDTFQAVECAKYLEILVENLLSWGSHIRHLNLKSTRGVGILTKLGKFVSKDILKSLYFTFVQSHIDYDLILCGTAMNSTTKKKKARNLKKNVRNSFLKVTMLTQNHCLKNWIYWAFINKRHLILFSLWETV